VCELFAAEAKVVAFERGEPGTVRWRYWMNHVDGHVDSMVRNSEAAGLLPAPELLASSKSRFCPTVMRLKVDR
jgi:hypothetical protein